MRQPPWVKTAGAGLLSCCLAISACSSEPTTEDGVVNESGFDDPFDAFIAQVDEACGDTSRTGDRDVIDLDRLPDPTRGTVIRSWQVTVGMLTAPNPVTCEPMAQTTTTVAAADAGAFDSAAFTLDSVDLRYDLYFYDPAELENLDLDDVTEMIRRQLPDDHQISATTSLDAIVIAKIHPTATNDDRNEISNAYGQVNNAYQ